MAYKTVVTDWLLSQRDSFSVSFTEFTWGSPDLTDIRVELGWDEVFHTGRGTHGNGDLALEKACAEAIERLCCYKLGISTVGCAVHVSSDLSYENSKVELMERFIFEKLQDVNFSSRTTLEFSRRASLNSSCKYWTVDCGDRRSITICIFFEKKVPISLGLSFGCDSNSFDKAYNESLRNYAAYKENRGLFYAEVKSNKNMWCCDRSFLNKITSILESKVERKNIEFEMPAFFTKTIKVSQILDVDDCPLYFSRSWS